MISLRIPTNIRKTSSIHLNVRTALVETRDIWFSVWDFRQQHVEPRCLPVTITIVSCKKTGCSAARRSSTMRCGMVRAHLIKVGLQQPLEQPQFKPVTSFLTDLSSILPLVQPLSGGEIMREHAVGTETCCPYFWVSTANDYRLRLVDPSCHFQAAA